LAVTTSHVKRLLLLVNQLVNYCGYYWQTPGRGGRRDRRNRLNTCPVWPVCPVMV